MLLLIFSCYFREPQYPHQNASNENFYIIEQFFKGRGLSVGGLIDEQQLQRNEGQGKDHPTTVEGVDFVFGELGKVFDPNNGQNREQVQNEDHPNEIRHLQVFETKIQRCQHDLYVNQ